jgi:hypothetical protein
MPSKTTNYYNSGTPGANKAKKKKLEYQKEYNKQDREVKKRVELNKINRENHRDGKSSVSDGKDVSHHKNGTKLQKASVNRGSKTAMPGDKRARGNGRQK